MIETVKVRILVAVAENGSWSAAGWDDVDVTSSAWRLHAKRGLNCDLEHDVAYSWVTAELPVPSVPEVEGAVEEEK